MIPGFSEVSRMKKKLKTHRGTWKNFTNGRRPTILFNGKKFEMLRYGKNQDLKNSTNYLTPGAEDLIEVKETLRDL